MWRREFLEDGCWVDRRRRVVDRWMDSRTDGRMEKRNNGRVKNGEGRREEGIKKTGKRDGGTN